MAFALANDQLRFVRLFIEKFNMHEYLTYGLLEKLYSRVDEGTLVYELLLECLKKRLGTSWKPDPSHLKEISLFEVGLSSDKSILVKHPGARGDLTVKGELALKFALIHLIPVFD